MRSKYIIYTLKNTDKNVAVKKMDNQKELIESELRNVYGKKLKTCSSNGMAVTGWQRDGFCSHHRQDKGSHHVCVKNIDKNKDAKTFCDITGQEDWCSEKDICHGDSNKQCDRKKWCTCEWAFDRYVGNNGCDSFDIDCNATNKLVIEHYKKSGKKEALKCIKDKCKL